MRLRPFLTPLSAAVLATVSLTAGIAALPTAAHAAVEVDINKGVIAPLPIAIPAMSGADARAAAIGSDVSKVIAADLGRSGYFKPLDPASFIQQGLDVEVQPNFNDWRTINAQALVNGKATVEPDGRLRVDFRLWDTFGEKQLLGLQFTSTGEDWRRVAHKISDAVYKALTGQEGYFDTRVVFVAENGSHRARIKRLGIMDQDGANPSYLTEGNYLALSPHFSPNGRQVTYTALRADSARVYLLDLETNRQEALGSFEGMVFAPRFSPDGNKVAFSVDRNGNTDIYVMDLHSRVTSRLTSEPSIDTSPAFSPDGRQLVFNSDRGGSPQLYVMSAEGANPHRISFGEGRYTAPVWSPKGDLIAFVRQNGGEFHIGVMNPDGSGERILTSAYLDESPAWAPNGRLLIFAREAGPGSQPHLWTVDVSGQNAQPAPYTLPATDPAWSPTLK
jgi:TolB protein